MTTGELLLQQFQTVHGQINLSIKDLTIDQVNWKPKGDANTIGFLLWHVVRVWDGYQAIIDGDEESYEKGDWSKRFGFETHGLGVGGKGVGTGFTPEDVSIVQIRPPPLVDYLDMLFKRTNDFLNAATDETLGQLVRVPWWPRAETRTRVFSHIATHSFMHIGQAQYVKGLLIGKWTE